MKESLCKSCINCMYMKSGLLNGNYSEHITCLINFAAFDLLIEEHYIQTDPYPYIIECNQYSNDVTIKWNKLHGN